MHIDWQSLFVPDMSLVELVLRGSAIYLGLFALLRILVRRHVGAFGLTDLLVIVLIADAAQNGMASDYKSLTEAFVVCGTIVGWSFLLDWLHYSFPKAFGWLEPPPLPLVRDGVPQRAELRKELVSDDELASLLREHGVEDIREVRLALIEPGGQVSVFKRLGSTDTTAETHRRPTLG